jgi:hypothetical protein
VQVEQRSDGDTVTHDLACDLEDLAFAVVLPVAHLRTVQTEPHDVDVTGRAQIVEDPVADLTPHLIGSRERRLRRRERSGDELEPERRHRLAGLAVAEAHRCTPRGTTPPDGHERSERRGDRRERTALVLHPGDETTHRRTVVAICP